MTRSDSAMLGVGDAKGRTATQKVMRNTVTGAWWMCLDMLSSATSIHQHILHCCALCLLPCYVMGSDHARKYEEKYFDSFS